MTENIICFVFIIIQYIYYPANQRLETMIYLFQILPPWGRALLSGFVSLMDGVLVWESLRLGSISRLFGFCSHVLLWPTPTSTAFSLGLKLLKPGSPGTVTALHASWLSVKLERKLQTIHCLAWDLEMFPQCQMLLVKVVRGSPSFQEEIPEMGFELRLRNRVIRYSKYNLA